MATGCRRGRRAPEKSASADRSLPWQPSSFSALAGQGSGSATPYSPAYSTAERTTHNCSSMSVLQFADEPTVAMVVSAFGRGLSVGEHDEPGSLQRGLSALSVEPFPVHHRVAFVPIWHRKNLQISAAALFRQPSAADHDGRSD